MRACFNVLREGAPFSRSGWVGILWEAEKSALPSSSSSEFQVIPGRNSIETCLETVRNCAPRLHSEKQERFGAHRRALIGLLR